MKFRLLLILSLLGTMLFAQNTTPLEDLSTPQFASPLYDGFSRNYLGAEAAGRGYTGAAVLGSISGALINPAVLMPDSAMVFTEIGIKPPQNENTLPFNSNYVSTTPLGMFGFSGQAGSRFALAALYSNPKSIMLESYSILINQGAWIVERKPKYNLHQFSGLLSYKAMDNLNLGIALNSQIHSIADPLYLRTYDRVERTRYALRIQPGMLYRMGYVMVGASAILPAKIDWDLRYGQYESTLPLEVTGGISFSKENYRFSGDISYINDKAVDSRFSDRYGLHLGAEQREGNRIFRAGYMYRSNIWDGMLKIPENTANPDSSMFWDDLAQEMPIRDNQQHFLSVGLGYLFKFGQINISAMQCIVGDTRQTQINLGLGIKLNTFMRKELPPSY